jgi:hypothetical protein
VTGIDTTRGRLASRVKHLLDTSTGPADPGEPGAQTAHAEVGPLDPSNKRAVRIGAAGTAAVTAAAAFFVPEASAAAAVMLGPLWAFALFKTRGRTARTALDAPVLAELEPAMTAAEHVASATEAAWRTCSSAVADGDDSAGKLLLELASLGEHPGLEAAGALTEHRVTALADEVRETYEARAAQPGSPSAEDVFERSTAVLTQALSELLSELDAAALARSTTNENYLLDKYGDPASGLKV